MPDIFHDQIKNHLHGALMEALKQMTDQFSPHQLYGHWTTPPQMALGHLSFPCFSLSPVLKRPPAQIAQELAQNIPPQRFIRKLQPTGPYLNFFLNMHTTAPFLLQSIGEGTFFSGPFKTHPPKTMIEYFQPNTHKEIHVGHLRNLCLGQAMVEIHRYLGYDIVSATYPGDSGAHVAKVLWYLQQKKPPLPDHSHQDLGEWLGDLYTQANQLLAQEQDPQQREQNHRELAAIVKAVCQRSGQYFSLWEKTRQWSLQHIQNICQWAGAQFDHWYFESEMDAPSLAFAQKLYREGKLIKDDGAIGMDLKAEKLGICLLIKRDGNGLYATKDLELARKKFDDYGIEQSIYVVDKRQALHFKQVFKTLEKIGYPQAKNCHHLAYEFVELPEGAISSRSGHTISAQTLIAAMKCEIEQNFLSRYSDWDQPAKDQVADQVAQAAIKYGMISVDNNKKIVFNLKNWLKLDGESGPYIQYVHARIHSLLAKTGLNEITQCDWSELQHPLEESLLLQLSQFNHSVENACAHYNTALLASYLYHLAKKFNSFYAQCPVLKAPTENQKMLRAHLAHKTSLVLKKGLALLAIPAPEKM